MNSWTHHSRLSMIRVTATKDNVVMPFVVDVLDTPGFFNDREDMTDESGHTKRIFHVVRAHTRDVKGKVRGIKMHFAGLRQFNIDCVVEDVTDEEMAKTEFVELQEMAEIIADHINAPGKGVAA
jgi:hypothetical protein